MMPTDVHLQRAATCSAGEAVEEADKDCVLEDIGDKARDNRGLCNVFNCLWEGARSRHERRLSRQPQRCSLLGSFQDQDLAQRRANLHPAAASLHLPRQRSLALRSDSVADRYTQVIKGQASLVSLLRRTTGLRGCETAIPLACSHLYAVLQSLDGGRVVRQVRHLQPPGGHHLLASAQVHSVGSGSALLAGLNARNNAVRDLARLRAACLRSGRGRPGLLRGQRELHAPEGRIDAQHVHLHNLRTAPQHQSPVTPVLLTAHAPTWAFVWAVCKLPVLGHNKFGSTQNLAVLQRSAGTC